MKIAVWSDLHLGKRMYRTDENNINKYEQAGYKAAEQFVNTIIAEKPDILINCGDSFEIANPHVLPINIFARLQKKLHEAKIPLMTIIGNHEFSFANKKSKCSAAEMAYHDYFADYEIKTEEIDGILFVLAPYVYDTDANIEAYLNKIDELASNSTCDKKILVIHGMTEKYHRDNPMVSADKILLSDELAEKFNLVLIGHIHTPFAYKHKDTLVISPGALIDYQAYVDRTGPCFIDTDDWSFKRIKIKTPHIIKVECNKNNINETLKNVEEDMIYHISFKGDTSVIDNDLFIEAKNKTINLVIDVIPDEKIVEVAQKKLDLNLFSWVAQNYPDYKNQFEKAKEALV